MRKRKDSGVLPDMSTLTARSYGERVKAWTAIKGGDFPILDSQDEHERKQMEAWLGFWQGLGKHGGMAWRVKQLRAALRGKGEFGSRWTFPAPWPSDMTGNTNDDRRGLPTEAA